MDNVEQKKSDLNSAESVTDNVIVRAAIHPGIGVARVGNSTADDGYYIGPEVTTPPAATIEQMRDGTGAIKRQAARFRIYGYNAAGEVVGEINSDTPNSEIAWTVQLANKKAAWYRFDRAFDIPEADGLTVPRRNADVTDRKALVINPGPRTIEGRGCWGPEYHFDSGTFRGTPVPLGELRTDEAGRLLVLGGFGKSASPDGKPIYNDKDGGSFNNADGWYDDTSDGSVSATVTIDGKKIPVAASWVVVAPPDYAPDVVAWRTMYDLLLDTHIESGLIAMPSQASFAKHVLPALNGLSNLQWVNKGFAAMFGKGAPMDFEDSALIDKLASKAEGDPYKELRQTILNAFRSENDQADERRSWPWIYGDVWGGDVASPRHNLALSKVQQKLLELWVDGKFVDDRGQVCNYETIDAVPLAEQPGMLDQAGLHFCVADAFHPGCEMTWPMRHASMYCAPFRIRHRTTPEADYGGLLTQDEALEAGGPLYAQAPGDITRWMAIPWQADTSSCRSGYDADYDPYLPTFWPAVVPNQVLTEADYNIVMNESNPQDQRIAAYNKRQNWLRDFPQEAVDYQQKMVDDFGKMGIVIEHDGPADHEALNLPEKMLVEDRKLEPCQQTEQLTKASRRARRLAAAGWQSVEQFEAFRKIRKR